MAISRTAHRDPSRGAFHDILDASDIRTDPRFTLDVLIAAPADQTCADCQEPLMTGQALVMKSLTLAATATSEASTVTAMLCRPCGLRHHDAWTKAFMVQEVVSAGVARCERAKEAREARSAQRRSS